MPDAIGVLIRNSARPEFGHRIHSLPDSPFVRLPLFDAALERFVANCAVSAPITACLLPMVAMRSTALCSGDRGDHIQNSLSLMRRVWDHLVPIRICNDSVRRARFELVLDQDAIRHELHHVGGARPSRWTGSGLEFNGYESIGSLD
jgi:hypothetical protein